MKTNGHAKLPSATERIRRKTSFRVAQTSARGPAEVRRRLHQLEREISAEQASQALWAGLAVLGLWLHRGRNRKWLSFSGAAAGLLAQAAVTGWNPAYPLLRRLGLRNPREIAEEREALKEAL